MSDASLGTDPVLFERRGHVAIMTLNRPEVLNAVNRELSLRAGEALDEIDSDPGPCVSASSPASAARSARAPT